MYKRCRANDVRTNWIRLEFFDVFTWHAPTGGIAALIIARIIVDRGSQQEHIPNDVWSPRCKNGPEESAERVAHEVDFAGCRVLDDDVREFIEGGADSRSPYLSSRVIARRMKSDSWHGHPEGVRNRAASGVRRTESVEVEDVVHASS